MTGRRLREDALEIWTAGVRAVEAGNLVRRSLSITPDGILAVKDTEGLTAAMMQLSAIGRIAIVGAGKATTAMADGLEWALGTDVLREKQVTGWVNVPDATVKPLHVVHVHGARSRPDNRPTAEGVEGSRRILEIAQSLTADDLLFVLLSGGASALLPLPSDGISLEDKVRLTALLQERGATIDEMNCVRKHLSQIKGGRLAQATAARVVALVVSDVIGDRLDVIGSGPTAPDPTSFADAIAILGRLGLSSAVPTAVLAQLERGAAGGVAETARLVSDRVTNVVVGNNDVARQAAVRRAEQLGYGAIDLGLTQGDTTVAARGTAVAIVGAAHRVAGPICFVDGGETTVSLPADHGKGGRNQEFVLTVLNELGADGLERVCVLSAGTDGEDGPTDAAGAVVDEDFAGRAAVWGLDAADFLRRHDAYTFFDEVGGLVKTGPTNTNVMDLRVILLGRV